MQAKPHIAPKGSGSSQAARSGVQGYPSDPPERKTRQRASHAARVHLREELTVNDPVALLDALARAVQDGELTVAHMRYERRELDGTGPALEVRFRSPPRTQR
jgi:hypothetical protein